MAMLARSKAAPHTPLPTLSCHLTLRLPTFTQWPLSATRLLPIPWTGSLNQLFLHAFTVGDAAQRYFHVDVHKVLTLFSRGQKTDICRESKSVETE